MAGIKNLPVGAQGPRALGIANPMTGTWTENGVGALMPWNDRLYFLTYPAENEQADGQGLFSIATGEASPTLELETNACDVGRMVHYETKTCIMGRTIVDIDGDLTPITGFHVNDRICGYSRHPLSPTTKVIALTMSSSGASLPGKVYEVTIATAAAVEVASAATAASATADTMSTTSQTNGSQHFKGVWTAVATSSVDSRIYVVNNRHGLGTLSVLNPNTWTWTPLTTTLNASWINVGGCYMDEYGSHVFATGIDAKSGLLAVIDNNAPAIAPAIFRIPMPTYSQYHRYQQEWMRLREVSTERFLLDLHGTWFDISPYLDGATPPSATAGAFPRIRALSRHYNTYPDFCAYDGHLAVAISSASPHTTQFPDVGQPVAGIAMRDLEDVMRGPKPDGVGYWHKAEAATTSTSTPMLLKGFDRKELHLVSGDGSSKLVDIKCRMTGMSSWFTYTTLTVPANGHAAVELPNAEWCAVAPQSSFTTLTSWVACS